MYSVVACTATCDAGLVEFEEYKQSYVAEVEQTIDVAGQSHDFFIRVKVDELVASCGALRPFLSLEWLGL